jgi:hypothetical protein
VPKRPCTQRAEWRLQPGKPAERLSEHYQLDCDYGTALITIYKESDSIEPIYLCESHVAEVARPVKNAVVRDPAAEATDTRKRTKREDRAKREDRIRPAEVPSEVKASPAAAKPGRVTKDPLVKAPVRDLTYGSSAKALVDEAIWNLASGDCEIYRTALRQGKPAIEAAQAAGGQLAIVHRKIGEYTLTIEALLSESTARINAAEVINKPLEQATLEIIGSSTMGDAEKDAAVGHLGALQESLNRGLNQEITPLQAHRVACAVGDRANWGASADPSEELKPAYRAVYSNVRNAIIAAVPDALSVVERLANLYVAKAELEDAPQPKLSHHADSVSLAT